MKKCSRCKESKPISEFGPNRRRGDGLQTDCKLCKKDLNKQYYAETRASRKELRRRARKERYDYIAKIKSVPCADCKIQYIPYVMDFDHVQGDKVGNISQMCNDAVKWEKLLEEIAKCDIVCANCHRIRTFTRNASVAEMV
jgi:hypothetical protein